MGKIIQIRVPTEYVDIARKALGGYIESNKLNVSLIDIIPEEEIEGHGTITYVVSEDNPVLGRIKLHNFAKNDLREICLDGRAGEVFNINQGLFPVKGGVNEYAK